MKGRKRRKGKDGWKKKNGEKEERLFRIVKIAYHPDLNSIRNPRWCTRGRALAQLYNGYTRASMHGGKKGRGTNSASCKIKSQFVLSRYHRTLVRFLFDFSRLFEKLFFFSLSLSLFLFFEPKLQRYSVVPLNHRFARLSKLQALSLIFPFPLVFLSQHFLSLFFLQPIFFSLRSFFFLSLSLWYFFFFGPL